MGLAKLLAFSIMRSETVKLKHMTFIIRQICIHIMYMIDSIYSYVA